MWLAADSVSQATNSRWALNQLPTAGGFAKRTVDERFSGVTPHALSHINDRQAYKRNPATRELSDLMLVVAERKLQGRSRRWITIHLRRDESGSSRFACLFFFIAEAFNACQDACINVRNRVCIDASFLEFICRVITPESELAIGFE